MLFHFDFANYFRMLSLAWREPNPHARWYYLSVLLLWVPIVSTFHAICFFLDGILFPGLWKTEIRTPVFVVGHARSGTTLVHRLMSEDEGRFSVFVLYELYFPSLLQKKLIRFFAGVDRRYLGGVLEKRVRAWEDGHYAAMREVHKMGLTEAEEDDIVLYYSCASGFWITKMPYMGDLDFYYVDRFPERKRRRLMRFYKDCVRRQLHLNGGDKIHLSKNPIFAGRVASLIETFPDARIVVPLRNPYETLPSLLKLMRSGWKSLGWDEERQERCLRVLADQSFHTYRYPLEVLERHPETPRAVVDYRDVVADPAATIERTYEQLGFPITPEFREVLVAEGKRARRHKSGHSYSLAEFGLEADEIRTQLADLFERFGWDEGAGGTLADQGGE
ncbi:MAG: sulfotransferase [Deltaproteobacteria bacterium]|nr:sulfotransferase [Deltaproteobacteria bacterium]